MQSSPLSSYHEIKAEVLRRIKDRVWPAGTYLPKETELATEFGCARATVNRALRELADQGIVERKRKSGTKVIALPVRSARFTIEIVRQTIEDQNAEYRYALAMRVEEPAPDWLASRLNLRRGQRVLHLHCVHYADNRPFQFEDRWINIAAVPAVREADLQTIGPNEWLLAEVPFTEAEISFGAIAANAQQAEFLGVPSATALFQLERTTYLRDQAVTLVHMTYHAGYRMMTRY